MDTVGGRLDFFIRSKGYDKLTVFCEEHGFVYGTIVQTVKGRRLGIDVLDKIAAAFPNLNINWLLYGRGPMEVDYSLPGWITDAALGMAMQLKNDKALREMALKFLNENQREA
ncbi:hypothetical protein ACLI09_08655 [Flavobacterium sp. RHBU_24]|uniref:hypothetical protein n=1 Tax=Flavobacterium sp. RHBU_24 TaxID=3391185 RepID=UPI003984ADE8